MSGPNTTVGNGYDPTKFDILSDNGSGSTWPGVNAHIGSGSQPFQIDPQDPYGIGAAAIGLNNGDGIPSFNFDPQNPYGAQLDLSKGDGIQPLGLSKSGYTPQDGDRELLARIIFSEGAAVSNDYPALAWAIVNRVGARGFPSTLQGVINQTDSKGRPELGINTPLWVDSGNPDSLAGLSALSYQKALSVADGVLDGTISDPTRGARYFYSGDPPSKGFFPNAISSGRLVPAPPGTAFKFYRDTQN